jgi:hypothetical protein
MSDNACTVSAAVAADLASRAERGLAKYGVTLADAPLTRAALVRHAYEESLDLACYLRRLLDEVEAHDDAG